MIFFPLVGGALGVCAGALLEGGRYLLAAPVAAGVVLAFLALLTGGLHEDGLADVADAFRAWRSPEEIHRILKDSRVGAHGALALCVMTLLRWQALSSLTAGAVSALGAALAISRASIVGLLWIAPAAGGGSALAISQQLKTTGAVGAVAFGVAFALWPGPGAASAMLGVATAVVLLARAWFEKRIGGVTGDCLGATCIVVETACLMVLTCPPCSW